MNLSQQGNQRRVGKEGPFEKGISELRPECTASEKGLRQDPARYV